MKKRYLCIGLLAVLAIGNLLTHVWAAVPKTSATVTVLGTSDLHGRLYPWDYAIDTEDKLSGLAKVASVVKAVRSQNPNTILVDNGDTIQDNLIELFNSEKVHPMVAAMNELNYATWTLGNHEFNFGLPLLNKVIKNSKATVLAANIYTGNSKRFVNPYKIITVSGVKVALIGMVTPHIPRFESTTPANFKGLTFTDPAAETKKVIAELKGKADVLIGVMHLGPTVEYGLETSGVKAVAAANPELTAIIAGHDHADIAGMTVNGVLIVEPKVNGAKVSRLDITLDKINGKWQVKEKKSENIDIAKYEADPQILAKFKYVHERSQAEANIVIGKIAADFMPEGIELLPGIPVAQIQDTALIDFVNEVQMYYTKADIASAALFSSNSNLSKGDFKKKDVANIYKYTNTLIALKVTGKQLRAYMEWSAQYYNTAKPGDVTLGFNPQIRNYNYDMFSGVNYDINVAAPAGKRIENLTFKGKPVTDEMTFTLAVNNYRFGGMVKDGFFNESDKIYDSYEKLGDKGRIRDLIVDYVQKHKTIEPKLEPNWKITGVSLDHPLKDAVYQKVKAGELKIPTSADGRTPNVKALNVYDLIKEDVLKYKVVDIVTINDFHGSIVKNGKNIGIANLVNEIKQQKAANPDTLFVAGGDLFQGSAESNLLYGQPVAEAFKEAGLTASAIGNHEYDWGNKRFSTWEKEGGFAFLAANIYDRVTQKPVAYAKPYQIVNCDGIKVALIGLSTPETSYKTKPENVQGVEFKEPVEVLPLYIKEVREKGAQLVIALTHLGATQDKSGLITGEAADLGKVAGLDAIVAGHTHESIAGKVGNIPFVMAYYNGRTLGKISFIFENDQTKAMAAEAKLDHLYLRPASLKEDEATKTILKKHLTQIEPILSEKIGVATVNLDHDTRGPSLMGEWVCDIIRKHTGAQIAFQNGGGLRTSLPKGDLTVGSLYTLLPFDNTLVTAKLTGSQIKEAIENGIGNPKISFGQVAGVKVKYDLAKPFGARITALALENGQPLEMEKTYTVVANDFMFSGGDNYTSLTKGKEIKDTGVPIRDAVIEFIKKQKTISPVYKGYQAPAADTKVKPAA